MSLDLASLSPSARSQYLRIGKLYGSPDTLAQANQTLQALAKHGPDLAPHGFTPDDTQRLTDARDGLSAASQGRVGVKGSRKVSNAAFVAAMKDARAERGTARSILKNTRRVLHDQGGPAAEAAILVIDAALAQTSRSGDAAEELASQLDTLHGALSNAAVAAAAATRGGPAELQSLEAKAESLRTASNQRPLERGTRNETEDMDVLDGIIVTLARDARRAAKGASRRTGKAAMAADFELTHLREGGKDSADPGNKGAPVDKAQPANPPAPPNS